jgi:hypothetical protein
MKKLIPLFLLIALPVFADFHLGETDPPKDLHTLVSERCLSMADSDEFFKIIWASDEHRLDISTYKDIILSSPCLSDADKIHLEIYQQRGSEKIIISSSLSQSFESMVSLKTIPRNLFQLLITYDERIEFEQSPTMMSFWRGEFRELIDYYKTVLNPPFVSSEELVDLYHRRPDLSSILDGKYESTVRLFLFCRRNRDYHCLFTAKDKNGRPLKSIETGEIWSQPALAQSARGLSSNIVNGRTPQGVHTIDSVMPYADQYRSFGKYRRIILNWVPTQDDSDMNQDDITKSLLSPMSENSFWWRQASISRDLGRTDLRIHGTGKINDDPRSTYYPLRKSNGCITQREGSYGDKVYHDQRITLNQMMNALELPLNFENEQKISGVLYLVEIDGQEAPVLWPEVALKLGLAENNGQL